MHRIAFLALLAYAEVDRHERPVEGNAIAASHADAQARGFLNAKKKSACDEFLGKRVVSRESGGRYRR
jgi:hypothetical protein